MTGLDDFAALTILGYLVDEDQSDNVPIKTTIDDIKFSRDSTTVKVRSLSLWRFSEFRRKIAKSLMTK